MVEIRMTQGGRDALVSSLLARRDVESKAFALCGAAEGPDKTALLVREVVPVPPSGYAERSGSRVVTRGEFVRALLDRCEAEGLSLLEAHTHPWDSGVGFSPVDDASDARKFAATEALPPPFRHATAVLGGDGSFQARLWDRTARAAVPVDRVTVVAAPLRFLAPAGRRAEGLPARQRAAFARQVGAFGEAGQAVLRDLRVAVVGAGGLGSQAIQQLALLGVGQIALVDPDRLEETNANRVVGVTAGQVRRGILKVKAIAGRLLRVGLHPPQVLALAADARSGAAMDAVTASDVTVGAVDSAAVRGFLNALCASALVPYVDGGVGITAEGGRIQAAGGQVRVVLPGATPCLACLDEDARARSEEQHTPGQREAAVRAGYVRGEEVPAPQVAFLNGVVASALVWEVVKLATGCGNTVPYVYYDLMAQRMFEPDIPGRDPGCLVCGKQGLLAGGRAGAEAWLLPEETEGPPPGPPGMPRPPRVGA